MPTRIEWTDETWNPITGCSPVSAGCDNCYARRMATRLRGRYGYPQDEPFRVTCQWKTAPRSLRHPDGSHTLTYPRRFKKPRKIFVCSMGDLFHEEVTHEMFMPVWRMIESLPRHIFVILTKRPKLMSDRLFNWCFGTGPVGYLPNVWLGVSVEDQKTADERIPILLRVPAAVRVISYEPALGALDIEESIYKSELRLPESDGWGIDWVICGGETGPGARPMNPEWARQVRDQCVAAGVRFFFKQHGMWTPELVLEGGPANLLPVYPFDGIANHRRILVAENTADRFNAGGLLVMKSVTKKIAGRLLDGREWNEIPEVR